MTTLPARLLIGSVLSAALVTNGCSYLEPKETGAQLREGESIGQTRLNVQVEEAALVFRKLLTSPDGGVPEQLLGNARCVVIMPDVVKAAFIGGGRFGRGVVTCKNPTGGWTPPAFVVLTGGSIGFQIGAESADLVLFFTGEDSKASVLSSSGLTLGADIGVAAGPVGRKADAKTNFSKTGIFSYAASQGIFAGVSLEGAVMSGDREANREYYGVSLTTADVILERKAPMIPDSAQKLLSLLPPG